MSNYLVDTTLLVEHLRGNDKARVFLEKHTLSISTVTIAELLQGSRDKNDMSFVLRLCDNLPEAEINRKIANKAIQLLQDFHLSHGLLFWDALIAATAIENKLTLVTGTVKQFLFIKELQILSQTEALQEDKQ